MLVPALLLPDWITRAVALLLIANVGELTVTSRTSVMPYAGSAKDVRTIAAGLGVTHIVEGTVQRAGGQVRATVQLMSEAPPGAVAPGGALVCHGPGWIQATEPRRRQFRPNASATLIRPLP